MKLARRIACELKSIFGTITMPEFWLSWFDGPLVTFTGHVWDNSTRYAVKGEIHTKWKCVDCGKVETYGTPK